MSGSKSKWMRFSPLTVQALFDAVDIDDIVDAQTCLPDPIVLTCSEATMRHCFSLCLQFWETGFSREELSGLVQKLIREGSWTADERMIFKFIRARFKHLRFAQQLYGNHHNRSRLLGRTTIYMGHLQDAYRGEDRAGVVAYGRRLRVVLSKPVWASLRYVITHTRLDDAAGFAAYRLRRIRCLEGLLTQAVFTGGEFHNMRKIISEQVSHYDTLRSLDPAQGSYYRMSRYLAAINGLMGARHDEMVADAQSGRQSYHASAPLDESIRERLEVLVARYQQAHIG